MAAEISVIASIITVAALAINSSKELYATIDAYKNADNTLKEFGDEVHTVQLVLETLKTNLNETPESKVSGNLEKCLRDFEPTMKSVSKLCDEFRTKFSKQTDGHLPDTMDARDKIKFLLKDKAVLAYKYRLNSHKVTINIIVGLVTLIKLKDDTKVISELHNNIIEAIAKISGQREGMQISSQSIGPPDDAARETTVPSEDDIVTYELGQCLTVVLSAVDAAPANVKWSIGKMESFDNAVHTASITQGKSGLVRETSAHGRSTLTVTDTALPDEYWKMTFGSRRSGSN